VFTENIFSFGTYIIVYHMFYESTKSKKPLKKRKQSGEKRWL
jgi:hypothetical protein